VSATAAEVQVERDYERLKSGVLRSVARRLTARGLHVDDADLDAFYNQAWHGLYARLAAGEEVESPRALLITIAERRAIDEARALQLERRVPVEDVDDRGVELDIPARLDDRLRLRQFTQGLRDRLSERERQAASLCYVHGFTRPEAARALGVSERRMEKIMDRAAKKVGALVGDIERGEWCESRRSLITAYALGLLDVDGARYVLAVAHLEDCPACRRRVQRIRGLAAIAPPVPVLAAGIGASGGRRARTARTATITAAVAGALAAAAAAVTLVVTERGEPVLAPARSGTASARAATASSKARAAAARTPRRPHAARTPTADSDARRPRAAATRTSTAGSDARRPQAAVTRTPPAGSVARRPHAAATPTADTDARRPRTATSKTHEGKRRVHAQRQRPAVPPPAPVATPPPVATTPAAPPAPAPRTRDYDGAGEFELR
jgi:RNA polymerase sigma factor (sigma-70 family)